MATQLIGKDNWKNAHYDIHTFEQNAAADQAYEEYRKQTQAQIDKENARDAEHTRDVEDTKRINMGLSPESQGVLKNPTKPGDLTTANASAPDLNTPAPADPNGATSYDALATYQQQAMDFRNKIPELSGQYSNVLGGSLRDQLAGQMKNIKANSNARGLLHSGIQGGANAQAELQAAQAYAPQMSNYNAQLQDQANQMDQQAITAGLNKYNVDLSQNDLAFRNALAERQAYLTNMNALPNSLNGLFSGAASGIKQREKNPVKVDSTQSGVDTSGPDYSGGGTMVSKAGGSPLRSTIAAKMGDMGTSYNPNQYALSAPAQAAPKPAITNQSPAQAGMAAATALGGVVSGKMGGGMQPAKKQGFITG